VAFITDAPCSILTSQSLTIAVQYTSYEYTGGHCISLLSTRSGVARILLQGARVRRARVPKFVVTKSSRSESHLALGLQKRIWLKVLQQPATVTGDFAGYT